MAINFPNSPSSSDSHTENGLTWIYDGTTWNLQTTIQSGATTFTGLTDTPSTYTGQGGKYIKVNSTPDGLEFTDAPTTSFTGLTDTPSTYTANKVLKVNSGGTGIEFADYTFTSLLDTPNGLTANKWIQVNGAGTGLSLVDAPSSGASVTTDDTPPSTPSDGDLWWDSQNGRLHVYYQDANSSQWVDATGRGVSNSSGSSELFTTKYWNIPLS
tara:strand:- start:91 stop:729 length:639 start_codon:yes stop_codon:yes gene_type:complete